MQNILEELFRITVDQQSKSCEYRKAMHDVSKNYKRLKRNLNENKRKLLLRIIDNKDLMSEEASVNSFTYGLKLGLELGLELNRDNDMFSQ